MEAGAPASNSFRELSRTHGVIIEGNFTKSYKDSEVAYLSKSAYVHFHMMDHYIFHNIVALLYHLLKV